MTITRREGITGRAVLIACAVLLLSSCLGSPDLPAPRGDGGGEAPQLLPIAGILAQTADGVHTARLTDATPEARAAALRRRAATLRGPVLTAQERARMLASNPRLR